jgi:copper homeostasis protein
VADCVPRLEVVATTLRDVRAAVVGGADRIELAGAHTSAGAISPSAGLMEQARRLAPGLEIFAVIRPRYGAFVYDQPEFEQMRRDIEVARASGMDGVFIGAVTTHGALDRSNMQTLFENAHGLRICINMAFDHCDDPCSELDWLIRDGRAERILTAGRAKTALDGVAQIAQLQQRAADSIDIMPGRGVDLTTLPRLLELLPAIAHVHVSTGACDLDDPTASVDATKVTKLKQLLRGVS